MPRRRRSDGVGAWHHVFNRGLARRTLFESARDARFFLSCLARQARTGDLEIHAYVLLTTHFHLFVRSPRGRLSRAMQRAQDAYARWFNRARGRDGPLFRGRFGNRLVETEAYALTLLRYIDFNPVDAGIVSSPGEYPYGSARHYLRLRGPPWLHRGSVEGTLGGGAARPWDPGLYRVFLGEMPTEGERWIAERRCAQPPSAGTDPLDRLLDAAPDFVRRWMESRAALADGTRPGQVLTAPRTILGVLDGRRRRDPGRELVLGRKPWPYWEVMTAGALRECCGLRYRELVDLMQLSRATVEERLRMHAEASRAEPGYLTETADVLCEALRVDFPARGRVARDGVLGRGPLTIPPSTSSGSHALQPSLPIP